MAISGVMRKVKSALVFGVLFALVFAALSATGHFLLGLLPPDSWLASGSVLARPLRLQSMFMFASFGLMAGIQFSSMIQTAGRLRPRMSKGWLVRRGAFPGGMLGWASAYGASARPGASHSVSTYALNIVLFAAMGVCASAIIAHFAFRNDTSSPHSTNEGMLLAPDSAIMFSSTHNELIFPEGSAARSDAAAIKGAQVAVRSTNRIWNWIQSVRA